MGTSSLRSAYLKDVAQNQVRPEHAGLRPPPLKTKNRARAKIS